MPLDPARVVTRLRELRSLTGDENGEQRVAWTDTWAKGRAWLAESLADLPLEVERDAAGNDWYTLRGDADRAVLIGGHMDSVPNGGWLDGCLNVLAGAEVLRRIAEDGTPPVTVRLVDWADEEGARFGRSLFGSSAAAGSMADQDELRKLTDRDGIPLPEAVGAYGVDLDRALDAHAELASAAGSPGRARRRTRARPRWTSAATRSPGRRSSPSRSATSRARPATARCAHRAASSASRASSPRSSRRRSSSSTSAISTQGSLRRCSLVRRSCHTASPRRRTSTSRGSESGRSSRSSSTRR